MPKTLISVDVNKPPAEQPVPLHNRWHPDIPPVVAVNPGEVFKVECIDWTGGQIHIPNSCCTLYIPTEIFEFDVKPSGGGPTAKALGMVAKTS